MKITRCLVALLAAAIVGCGNVQTGQGGATPGSTIAVSPSSKDWTASAALPIEPLLQQFTITVNNSAGNPFQGVNVDIFLDLAPGSSTAPTMVLLDDRFVPQPSPFRTQTDDFGNVTVYVEFPIGGGLQYSGSLQVFSGPAFGSAQISVTCDGC